MSSNINLLLIFFLCADGVPVSLVHDLPLWADKEKGIINIFIEIPRGTHAKLECHKTKPFNPITQDVKVDFAQLA